MTILTRRSVLRGSVGLAAAGALARPYIANAAATTAEVWWVQGFAKEEDTALKKMVADYEKASGNKIDLSIIPFAPLRQKAVAAIQSGVVPDIMEHAGSRVCPVELVGRQAPRCQRHRRNPEKRFRPDRYRLLLSLQRRHEKARLYSGAVADHRVAVSYLAAAGRKGGLQDLRSAEYLGCFLDFFMPVQDKLRADGMRNIYAYGYQLTANGVDPIATYNAFLIAYGGKNLVTPDGRLNTGDPQVRAAAAKAIEKLTTPFKKGYVPPGVVNWNDADDNNAFHAKLMVMDFDGTISTEVAIYDKKEDYDAIETRGLPLGNDGKPLTAQVITDGAVIPKGAKNVAPAKEFLKYWIQPKVLNEWLKGGLGRFMLPIPELVQERPVLAQGGPAPQGLCRTDLARSADADL